MTTPTPTSVAGHFWCHRAGQTLYEVQGGRSWLIAWAKISALGQCEARYQTNAPRVARDHRGELEQLDAQGVDLGRGQRRALQCQRTQALDEHVAERGQQHAQLIAAHDVATRARGEQADLRFLDPVLGLAALAIQLVVQRLRVSIEVGHDEARIAALLTPFEPRDDAPLVRPALRGVTELVHQALLEPGLLVRVLHRQLRIFDLALQPSVACKTHDVVHARALAIVDDALAAKSRVAAEDDAHLGPCLAQPRDQQLQDRSGVLRQTW